MPRNDSISPNSERGQASDTPREHQGQHNIERGTEDGETVDERFPSGEAKDAGAVPGQQTGRGEQQQREPWRKPTVGSQDAGAEKQRDSKPNDKEAAR